MKKIVVKHTPQEITELLESDDELPDSYEEIPDIPAYIQENRFTKSEVDEFYGLYQTSEGTNVHAQALNQESSTEQQAEAISTNHESSPEKCELQNIMPKLDVHNDKKILISKAVLTKRDLFLVKSIEEYTTDNTLLWFIDFLSCNTVKPVQRSCLVADVCADINMTKELLSHFNKRYYFKLVEN